MQQDDVTTIEFGFKEKVLQYYFLNKRNVLACVGVFVALGIGSIIYFASSPNSQEINQAKNLFVQWAQTPADKKIYKEMRTRIKKIAGLEKSLEAQIVQVLFTDGQYDTVDVLARGCLERLKKESPFYAAFSQSSLLIEKKEYQQALENSVALKEDLEKQSDKSSSLYASNLLRIAFLQKQVRNAPGELSAWEEVKALLQTNESTAAVQFLNESFTEKGFSLTDFIAQREQLIKQ